MLPLSYLSATIERWGQTNKRVDIKMTMRTPKRPFPWKIKEEKAMATALEQISQQLGKNEARVEAIEKTLASKASTESVETSMAKAEIRLDEKWFVRFKDVLITKADRYKFYAMLTLAAVSIVAGSFWHFRGEIKSDAKELKAELQAEFKKDLRESEARTEQRMLDMETRLSKQISSLSKPPAKQATP